MGARDGGKGPNLSLYGSHGRDGMKSARTANPVQTTGFSGVKKGLPVDGVDEGNPSMMAVGIGTILI
jgi:hypothetical protein